jgi:guanylate kinase
MPPSMTELENRLVTRGTDSAELIASRMSVARDEIRLLEHYNYAVVNDRVDHACSKIQAIITAEHCRRDRLFPNITEWTEEVK